jgi:toxin ParE1/3/4
VTVVFSDAAMADLEAIVSYIERFDASAAQSKAEQILQAIGHLETFPSIGRPGQHFATRELPVATTNYLIIYEGSGTTVTVLRLWDARRGGSPIPINLA